MSKNHKSHDKLHLYRVDIKYIRDLHNKDDKVPSVSPQIGKDKRVFLGIIVLVNGQKYCIPLSHPKNKHQNMKGKIDFTKIEDEKGKLMGVLGYLSEGSFCVVDRFWQQWYYGGIDIIVQINSGLSRWTQRATPDSD